MNRQKKRVKKIKKTTLKTSPGAKKKSAEKKQISGKRLWTFRLISLFVIPLSLLVLLEMSLRITGYGYNAKAVILGKVNGKRSLLSNDSFGYLFFPPKLSRDFDPFVIPAGKGKNTCRIVVLGASAVQGVPDGAYSFSRMLKVLLDDAYPGIEFEVFNAGMTAINSHCVLQIARDLRTCKADVFVIYLGNNEVVGPYGAGTVFSPINKNISLIRTGIHLRKYRLGQLISSLVSGSGENEFDNWAGMQMYLDQQVTADDPRLETVYSHFQKNLDDICSLAIDTGARVLLSTVGCNLRDCPPFLSVHKKGLDSKDKEQWDRIYQETIELEQAGQAEKAVEKYNDCMEIDDRYADLYFRLGRMYEKTAMYDKALESYKQAMQLDALRFRADDRINSIIRQVARDNSKSGVFFLDGKAAFAEHSEHGMPGSNFFYEHVHMTFEGNALLAETLLNAVYEALPQWVKSKRSDRPVLELEQLKERLAFTDFNKFNSREVILNSYIKKPPFTNQIYHSRQVKALENEIVLLNSQITKSTIDNTVDIYKKAIDRYPNDWWLKWKFAEFLDARSGDEIKAIEQCRKVLELVPQYRKGHLTLGNLLQKVGSYDNARKCYLRASKLKPDDIEVAYVLGLLSAKTGKLNEAEKWYKQVLDIDKSHHGANLNLGAVLSKSGKMQEAVDVYEKALNLLPDNVNLLYNLSVLYYRQGQKFKAIEYMRKARQLDPDSEDIQKTLKAMEGK